MTAGSHAGSLTARTPDAANATVPSAVATAGDTGRPLLLAHPASRPARALREIAGHLTAALDAGAGD
jgi:hypothetical protein